MKRTFPFLLLLLALPLVAETQRYNILTRNTPQRSGLRVVSNSADAIAHRVRAYANINAFSADLTPEEAAALEASGDVLSVRPVVRQYALALPPDVPAFSKQPPFRTQPLVGEYLKQFVPWGVAAVHASDVWSVTRGENVNVAVVDTGIDLNHPDLLAAYAGGYNVYDPTGLPIDDNKHGTHVSGIIAAQDNAFGVIGVAPTVKLWAVKVLDIRGEGYDDKIIAGLDWVISKSKEVGGRWVVNMSIGSGTISEAEESVLEAAAANGIAVIAAAGNRNREFMDYPGRSQYTIAVGALDSTASRATFSSYGPGLAVMAPGVDVPSTVIEGFNESADIAAGSSLIGAKGLLGSSYGSATGKVVECGIGRPEDFPASVKGNIALIQRGELKFRDKARNAKTAGAAAVVIYNNVVEETANWNMDFQTCKDGICSYEPGWEGYVFPVTIGVSLAEGLKLKDVAGSVTATFRSEKYMPLSGTSMATPHVTAIAALLFSLDPTLSVFRLRWTLQDTARDLGAPGWDMETGFGAVDALAAAKSVAPEKFGLPPTPQRRRPVRH
jgi:serine protease